MIYLPLCGELDMIFDFCNFTCERKNWSKIFEIMRDAFDFQLKLFVEF